MKINELKVKQMIKLASDYAKSSASYTTSTCAIIQVNSCKQILDTLLEVIDWEDGE